MAHADGGVGGHPAKVEYGGGFTGNVCTEDLVNLFESMGIDIDTLTPEQERYLASWDQGT